MPIEDLEAKRGYVTICKLLKKDKVKSNKRKTKLKKLKNIVQYVDIKKECLNAKCGRGLGT